MQDPDFEDDCESFELSSEDFWTIVAGGLGDDFEDFWARVVGVLWTGLDEFGTPGLAWLEIADATTGDVSESVIMADFENVAPTTDPVLLLDFEHVVLTSEPGWIVDFEHMTRTSHPGWMMDFKHVSLTFDAGLIVVVQTEGPLLLMPVTIWPVLRSVPEQQLMSLRPLVH